MRPPASVSRQRPCTSRPRNAQLRLRETMPASLTAKRSRRSHSARSASHPDRDPRARQPERARRAGRHALDDQLERHHARLDEPVHERRECRLEPDHAVRRRRERHLLLGRVVRRVVGRDAVDRAVAQALDERLPVRLGGQRRAHLETRGVEREHLLVGQQQVVRRGLGRRRRRPSCARAAPPRRTPRRAGGRCAAGRLS